MVAQLDGHLEFGISDIEEAGNLDFLVVKAASLCRSSRTWSFRQLLSGEEESPRAMSARPCCLHMSVASEKPMLARCFLNHVCGRSRSLSRAHPWAFVKDPLLSSRVYPPEAGRDF